MLKQFLFALQFLTILPIKIPVMEEKDLGRSLLYFPLVGMLIGVFLTFVLFIFGFLPPQVTVILILMASIIITGGIHLDGFADTCDGLYGHRTKEETLTIMRDSHTGAMGVSGIILLLLLKFVILESMPRLVLWRFLILMPAFARWSQVLACFSSDYVRQEGKAKHFIEYNSRREFLVGGVFTLVLSLLLLKFKGVVLMALCLLSVFFFISYIRKRIGGMTGDTVGAVNEIAEVFVLFFGLVLASIW